MSFTLNDVLFVCEDKVCKMCCLWMDFSQDQKTWLQNEIVKWWLLCVNNTQSSQKKDNVRPLVCYCCCYWDCYNKTSIYVYGADDDGSTSNSKFERKKIICSKVCNSFSVISCLLVLARRQVAAVPVCVVMVSFCIKM